MTVVAHQVAHYFEQVSERLHAIDEIPRGDHAPADKIERPANVLRRVMEAGFASDLGIVQQLRVQLDLAVVGATAEKVDNPAAAQTAGCSLPNFRNSDRFNGHVGAPPAGEFADMLHGLAG